MAVDQERIYTMNLHDMTDFSWLLRQADHPDGRGYVLVSPDTLRQLVNEHEQMRQHLSSIEDGDAIHVFLANKETLTQATVATYTSTLASFSRYMWEVWRLAFDDTSAMDDPKVWEYITPSEVLGFAEWMSREGYAPSTIIYRESIIKRMLKLAYTVGAVSSETIRAILDDKPPAPLD